VFLKYNGRALAQPEAIINFDQISRHNPWEGLQYDFSKCLSIVEYMKNS